MSAFSTHKIEKYVGEFLGSMFLVIFVKLSVLHFEFPAIPIGTGLAVIVYTFGYLSKAHYNPSVTLAFTVRDSPDWPRSDIWQIVMYYVMEYVGAITGGFLSWLIGGRAAAMVYPFIASDVSLCRAFVTETLFTFFLCLVILHVATDHRQSGNQFYGVAIGGTLSVSIMMIGSITGCCLNSAVWLGCILPALMVAEENEIDPEHLSKAWIYWTATFLGGALSAFLFNAVFARFGTKAQAINTKQSNEQIKKDRVQSASYAVDDQPEQTVVEEETVDGKTSTEIN